VGHKRRVRRAAVAQAFQCRDIRRVQQRLSLLLGQPVSHPHTDGFALFTRWMPAASPGASKPLSVAYTASLRIADIRPMIDEDQTNISSPEISRPWYFGR